jgi:SP family galactose:H+ symporter-like MFS transporter
VRIRQKCRKIIIGLIISLSALMFGYSLKEITSVPIKKIMEEYSITSVEALTAQSILIGILPIGSILGAIITKFLIKRFRRLVGIYIFTVVNIVAVILINITTFPTLIVGRFIEGVCIGYYCAIAPVYLKEIAPKELRKMLGLFFSFGKVVGVLVVIAMELIFDTLEVDLGWRVLLSMTAVFSLLQAVLIYFFGSDTPTEMIEKGQKEEAKKIIEEFYFKEYVDEVLH